LANDKDISLYNTADQVTNYERGAIYWDTNVFSIGSFKGGSGTPRKTRIYGGDTNQYLEISPSTAPRFLFKKESASGLAGDFMQVYTGFSASSGNQTTLDVNPSIGQSSTAGYTALLINPTESSVGSGENSLIRAQVGGVVRFRVANDGTVSITKSATSAALTVTSSATGYTNGGGTVEFGRTGNLTGVAGETFSNVKIAPAFTMTDPDSASMEFDAQRIDLSGMTYVETAGGSVNRIGLNITGVGSTSRDYSLSLSGGIFQHTSNQTTVDANVFSMNSLTSGYGASFSSSSNTMTSGVVFDAHKTATGGTTAFTGNVAKFNWTQNHNAAATLDHTANGLNLSRAITSNHASAAITVSGALVELNSTNVQTLGTLTDTGPILRATQGYVNASGDVISIANAGTGKDISGTGGTWSVSKAGAAILASLTVNSVAVVSSAGNLSSANGVASYTGSVTSITITNGIVTAVS
jgi:hypothetical protein